MHFQATLQCCTLRLIIANWSKVCETRASANNFFLHCTDRKTIWNCSELHKSPTPVIIGPKKSQISSLWQSKEGRKPLWEHFGAPSETPKLIGSFICVMRKLTPQAPSTCGQRSCKITSNTPGLIHSTVGPTFIMQHRLTAVPFWSSVTLSLLTAELS